MPIIVRRPGISLMKQLWMDVPQLPFGAIHGIIGLGILAYIAYKDEDRIGYQRNYVVFRSNDERAKRLEKFV